jgi:hypothetical protein
VFNDLADKAPLTMDEIREELRCGTFDGYHSLPSASYALNGKKWRDALDANTALNDKAADKLIEKTFGADLSGKVCFKVTYSDHDNSTMEHGGVFDSLTHIRVNKH